MKDYISIGKIINFFGIKGEAKVGYSNLAQIENAEKVYMLDNDEPDELYIQNVRKGKNFAIVKFKGIDDINDLIKYKGQRIFISKNEVLEKLDNDEYLINDLTGCEVFNEKNEKIGIVTGVSTNGIQDILNIQNTIHQTKLVPCVGEFFPVVDIKNKKIIIKPIEGLL